MKNTKYTGLCLSVAAGGDLTRQSYQGMRYSSGAEQPLIGFVVVGPNPTGCWGVL